MSSELNVENLRWPKFCRPISVLVQRAGLSLSRTLCLSHKHAQVHINTPTHSHIHTLSLEHTHTHMRARVHLETPTQTHTHDHTHQHICTCRNIAGPCACERDKLLTQMCARCQTVSFVLLHSVGYVFTHPRLSMHTICFVFAHPCLLCIHTTIHTL